MLSLMPYIVARRGDRVTLMFRRLLFRFQDTYVFRVEEKGQDRVAHYFEGEKSNITIEYRAEGEGTVIAEAEYQGPRKWVVSKYLRKMAESLIEDTALVVEKRRAYAEAEGDYSQKLASLSWTSRLLLKSLLVRNEITIIPKGGLMSYIEGLIAEKVIQKYPVVYVSGSGDSGSFRLLFVNGRLAGVYAAVGGKEYLGEEKVLNQVEGVTRIKVYATLSKPEEVLR